MQEDFHYYATYCAAYFAGYSHEDSLEICYSAQFVDMCSATFLKRVGGPKAAATTQLQLELMDARTDPVGLQDITRIWASFHFLPEDLFASVRGSRRYRNKYRLICGPNGRLLKDTVDIAKGRGTQAAGIAMHVLADTWAHRYFAGTPSLVINNTNYHFYEILDGEEKGDGSAGELRRVAFRHNPGVEDDLVNGKYTNSVYQSSENHIMNLGHGRAGHLPDYSFIRYKYLPAWGDYNEIIKDNPEDYYKAFCQMVYALRYLRGRGDRFELDTYEEERIKPAEKVIRMIIAKRRLSAAEDWKLLGENISGRSIPAFTLDRYTDEYMEAGDGEKQGTFLGKFFLSAMLQKSMVTNRIFSSGNTLAGISVDFDEKGFKGIKDFAELVERAAENTGKDMMDVGGDRP